ncbi:MAG: precorrin-3B C(17)-methyltransferase, partial [Candidatus Binatia bacterium]|nr:precorrin-3B C(17)-methyltransferase [Candidatus Binatia bacterium]
MRQLTAEAREVLEMCEVLVGYKTYVALIEPLIRPDQEVICYGMGQEVERGRQALALARKGKKVVLISSGDSGVYGMAGLAYELARDRQMIEVIPGVSCVNAAATLLGAPLMQDFAVISLSDLLIPWEDIRKRLELAARADFVLVLVNPRSQGRREQIIRAWNIVLQHRPATTPV